MSGGNTTTINISTVAIIKIVAIFLALAFIFLIRDILLTVFIAIILAAVLEPLVNRLEQRKIPRPLGVFFIYILLITFFTIVIRMLIPPLTEQTRSLASNLPDLWNRVLENFQSVRDYSQEQGYLEAIKRGLEGVEGNLSRAATSAYGVIIALFRNVVNFLLIMVFTFYLVIQKDAFAKILRALTPTTYHHYVTGLAERIQSKIGSWARGQLLLGCIIGTLSFFGLMFILPHYALVLAIIAGMTELVPYLGPILGSIPAIFLGLTVSPWHGLAVLILYLVIQWFENNLIVPQVMKRQVGLNPVVIIMAMMIGARLIGLVGVILAVPVATSIGLVLKDFIDPAKNRPRSLVAEDINKAG